MSEDYEALVIGGGIVGRSALYHLQRRGLSRVALVERFGALHERGSSHSHSRITRSAYVDAGYVRLMQLAHGEAWPQLEADAGEALIQPAAGCFFGPAGGRFEAYARAVTEVGVDCDVLDVAEARRRFPMFRFPTAAGAVHDRTAGVVAAARTMDALRRLTAARGARWFTQTRVCGLESDAGGVVAQAEGDGAPLQLRAERVIVAAGPWTAQLLPQLRPRLHVARQTVGYFVLAGDPADFEPGRWPVWGNLGAPEGEKFYGLPAFGREGIKLARHVTSGADDDPDQAPEAVAEADVARLRAFLEREFVPPVDRFAGAEHCRYTNTDNEDYIVDLVGGEPRIAVGAGFSGHGLKLAPVVGRALAELVCDGPTAMPAFEAMRRRFAFDPTGERSASPKR